MSVRLLRPLLTPILVLTLVLGASLFATADNHGDDELTQAIAQLNAEQKAALLVLVKGIVDTKASPKDEAMKTVTAYVKAAEEGDTEKLLACFSEDFEHYDLGNKAGLRAFIEGVEAEGMLEDISGNVDDAEAEVDGDTVTVYPVELEGIFGTVTYEFELKAEGGEWKIVGFDMTGV